MHAQKGFTLIEILVAVLVAALLLSAVYGAFGAVNRTCEAIGGSSQAYHAARVLYERLNRELRSLVAVGAGQAQLRGGKDEDDHTFLEFATASSQLGGGGRGGSAYVRYQLREDDETEDKELALFRSERPVWETTTTESYGRPLLNHVPAFEVRFFDGSSWLEEWTGSGGVLPKAVEVSLNLALGEEEIPFRAAIDLPAGN